MSTYITGMTDFVPQIQQFTPDYNMLGNVLQAKESQYQAGRKQMSEAYGKILYSPMSREDNIKKRDEFLKAIDQDIKKMAGMDLSLPQNQQAAMKVFNGFYDDKLIVKDMMWTKNFQGQQMKGDLLKTCVDPEKCGGQWWEGGDKELLYKRDEFMKMSANDAMNFQDVEYTPFHNVEDMAIKYAKASGFDMKMDVKSGGWIVTNKNGQIMEPHLAEAFLSKFGNEPAVRKMYKTQGYLNRKEWVNSNMALHNNDEAATNQAYVSNMMAMSEKAQEEKKKLDEKTEKSKNDKKLIENQVKKNGYYEGVDGKLKSLYDAISEDGQILEGAQSVAKNETDNYQSVKTNASNLKYSLDKIDDIVGINLLKAAVGKAAHHYSTLTAESSNLRADPYALQAAGSALSLRNSLTVAEANFKYGLLSKQEDLKNSVMKMQIEQQIKDGTFDGTLGGAGATKGKDGGLVEDPNITGTGENRGTVKPKDENYKMLYAEENRINSTKASYIQSFATEIAKGFNSTTATSEQKIFYKNALAAALNGTGISVDAVLKNNITPEDMAKLSKLSGKQLNNSYTMASAYGDPESTMGKPGKDFFSNSFYKATGQSMAKLSTEEKAYAGMKKKMEDVAVNSANQMIGDLTLKGGDNAKKAAIIQEYINVGGRRPFSKAEVFADYKTGNGAFAKIGKKYAEDNWKTFLPEVNPYATTSTATAYHVDKAKKKALAFYDNNVMSTMQMYDDHYNETAISYRQANLPGKSANALTSMGYSGYADSDTKGEAYNGLKDWGETYRTLGNDPLTKIAFGVANEIPGGTDVEAKKIADLILFDMNSAQKKGDMNRFRTNWHAQMVSGNDANYVSFTIKPDAAYLEKFKGTESKPGLLYGLTDRAAEGVTIFLPKNKVNNSFTAMMEGDPLDYEYNATGTLDFKSKYAKAEITRNTTTGLPQLTRTYSKLDPNGNLVEETETHYFTESEFGPGAKDFKASGLVDMYIPAFFQYDDQLEAAMQKVRDGKGVKDPNVLAKK